MWPELDVLLFGDLNVDTMIFDIINCLLITLLYALHLFAFITIATRGKKETRTMMSKVAADNEQGLFIMSYRIQ